MYTEGLTIIIPTYNREERLKQQLNSLFKQGIISMIKVVIIDNHSSYDILTSLKNTYSEEKLKNIEIIIRPFNNAYSHFPNVKEYLKRKFSSNYRIILFW